MNHRSLLFLLLLAAWLPACGSDRQADQEPFAKQPAADGAIHLSADQVRTSGVRSTAVVEGAVAPTIVVVGRVTARAGGKAEVFSPFPGRLVGDRLPTIGDPVTKGQRIAEVEQQFSAADQLQVSTTAIERQTAFAQAEQELQLKRTELRRAQQLFEGGAIPQKQLQSAEFDVTQAEAKLDGARRAKGQYDAAVSTADAAPRRAPIVAPISGTVLTADAALGEQVDPSKTLFTVADLRTVWVEAALPEHDLAAIRSARAAVIAIPGLPGSFAGALVTVGNRVDPENRTIPLIFSVDNAAGVLKIEMFVEARIPTAPPSTVLMVPASAVVSDAGVSSVYVESQPGVYTRRTVTLGDRQDDTIVVTAGLTKGERVVTVGAGALRSESLKSEIPVDEDEKTKNGKKD